VQRRQIRQIALRWAIGWLEGHQADAFKALEDPAHRWPIRPHDLRHTAATLLLLEGVQPLVVSEMLGHASVAFTLATYAHVQAEMRKPARDATERLFGGVFEA